MSELQLTADEELIIGDALRRRYVHDSERRGRMERHLADGHDVASAAAAFYEKRLAAMDGLLAKLPRWVVQVAVDRVLR